MTSWPLIITFSIVIAWLLSREKPLIRSAPKINSLSREYFVGLNYLLNEQPDKAVDVFIKLLEVDSDTVETHLALGSLFRRRGEVDRAIRIHQNLIARPQLSEEQRIDAMLALGRDYMSAGVLDRAEKIFREVVELNGGQTTLALQFLLDIYQQEKSWEQALSIARQLSAITHDNKQTVIAHYYCELAEMALKDHDTKEAKNFVKQALANDKNSVRASLLLGKIAMAEENYKAAIKYYKDIKSQDSDYLSEAILPIAICYKKLNNQQELLQYLHETLDEYPRVAIVLLIAEHLLQQEGIDPAIEFLANHLQCHPSLRGILQLIEWHLTTAEGKLKDKLRMLQELICGLLEKKPIYQCGICGFSGKNVHWQCPGCKKWGVIKPIHGLEGD